MLQKLPIWKQAIEDFVAAGFTYGDLIPHEWFHEHFGLETPVTAQEQKDFQTAMLANFGSLRAHMLEHYSMDLQCVRSTGYLVVRPEEQTLHALADTRKRMRSALAEGIQRATFVRHDLLTEEQRRENTDALAKLANTRAMLAPKKWLRQL